MPDGPWQAVTILLGAESTQLDLYPGGVYESVILSNQVCKYKTLVPCGSGNLFDSSASTTLDNHSILWQGQRDRLEHLPHLDLAGALKYRGDAQNVMDRIYITNYLVAVPNLSILLTDNMSVIYPDGSEYPLQVGYLSLASPTVNQSFSTSESEPSINASLLTGYYYSHNFISSSSYGLHIGSAALGLPLSLWLGGYDASRIVGPVSIQTIEGFLCAIHLLDIGIGVDHGASPFPFASQNGMLADRNSSIHESIRVVMNPLGPYLALPNSTCAAIATHLPVTYQTKYGLYFWNVNDPQFERIVSSPSYLRFTFRAADLPAERFEVKVPFKLLNLSLEAPLTDKATAYFPCLPPQTDATYSLGRAFLQAAFLGVDWTTSPGRWYLAQAPGPNTPSNPFQTKFESSSISPTPLASWSNSWEGFWTPLADNRSALNQTSGSVPKDPTDASSTKSADTGLSSGAKAGIVVGCATLPAALLIVFLYRRRSSKQLPNAIGSLLSFGFLPAREDKRGADAEPPELADHHDQVHELHGFQVHELSSTAN